MREEIKIENLVGEKFDYCEVMGKERGRHKEKETEIWQTSKKKARKSLFMHNLK